MPDKRGDHLQQGPNYWLLAAEASSEVDTRLGTANLLPASLAIPHWKASQLLEIIKSSGFLLSPKPIFETLRLTISEALTSDSKSRIKLRINKGIMNIDAHLAAPLLRRRPRGNRTSTIGDFPSSARAGAIVLRPPKSGDYPLSATPNLPTRHEDRGQYELEFQPANITRASLHALSIAVSVALVLVPCAVIQIFLLRWLNLSGVPRAVANATCFFTYTQLFYVTSLAVNKSRRLTSGRQGRTLTSRSWVSLDWLTFSLVASIALAVDEMVFLFMLRQGVPLSTGSLTGTASGAVFAFSVVSGVTYDSRTKLRGAVSVSEHRPSLRQIQLRAQHEGIAFFLPAYNEAQNLQIIVPKLVRYLAETLACPFRVIIVNDGSTADDTYETAERLAEKFFNSVSVVHHPRNMGYGAALKSGLRAALASQHNLIAFCDADNQFEVESLGTLLATLNDAGADLAVGYRIVRADSVKRRIMGNMWHRLSTQLLDFGGVRDVDCGFKLFTREVVANVFPHLRGDYATVSPELLARAKAKGYAVVESGISHSPRAFGRQTGSDFKVVTGSLVRLFELRSTIRDEEKQTQQVLDAREFVGLQENSFLTRNRDYCAWLVAALATVLSITSYIVADRLGAVLLYKDSVSHMEIARRVIDSTSPGLAQVGAVWLPLPHIMILPLVWDNKFYTDGFAGSIISMIAFVAMAVLMYLLVRDMTNSKVGGLAAASVLMSNVNMLYMQSTPMTEALLYFFIIGMILCVYRWALTGRYQYLILGGIAALLGTLTRYESWPILACLVVAVILIGRQRAAHMKPSLRRASTLDNSIVYVLIAALGIGAWLVWNWAIFKNPLYFQDGQFGKPSLWVSSGDPVIGNWLLSFKTYWYAMSDTETWPLLALAAGGLCVFLISEWRTREGAIRSLPVLSLLVIFPFFVICLCKGQRPMDVMQVQHDYYNVRFGLMMLMPTAIFIGYLATVVGKIFRLRPVVYAAGAFLIGFSCMVNWSLLSSHNVATYNEPKSYLLSGGLAEQDKVVAFIKHNYSGGRVLMESYGNEYVAFNVPSNELVYEGSYRQWQPALRDPAVNHIEWIIMSCQSKDPDLVCASIGKSELAPYKLAYHTPDNVYRVYQREI